MGRILIVLLLLGSPGFTKGVPKEITALQKQRMTLLLKKKKLLEELATLKKTLNDLSLKTEDKKGQVSHHHEEIAKQLLLLTRLGRASPLRLLVEPTASQNAIRGIILTRALTTALKHQVVKIQAELHDLSALRQDLEVKDQKHLHLLQTIENQQNQLKILKMENIKEWQHKEEQRLATENDVNSLLDESQAVLSKEEQTAQTATAVKGLPFRRLEQPVVGKVITSAPLQKKFSPKSQGILFETGKNAAVFSPSKGKIVFKGPFLSQGDILIIDHGKHAHTVFMGMDKISAEVGQNVYAGEKLGAMAGYGKNPPILYLELRQNGKAIDPKPYFIN